MGRWRRGGSRTRSTFPSLQPRWPRPRSAHLGNAAQPSGPRAPSRLQFRGMRAAAPAPSPYGPPRQSYAKYVRSWRGPAAVMESRRLRPRGTRSQPRAPGEPGC